MLPKDILNLLITEYFDGETLMKCLFVSKWVNSRVPLEKVDKARVEYALASFRASQAQFLRRESEEIALEMLGSVRSQKAKRDGKKTTKLENPNAKAKGSVKDAYFNQFMRCPNCNEIKKVIRLESHVVNCKKQERCPKCRSSIWTRDYQHIHHEAYCCRLEQCGTCLTEFPNWKYSPHWRRGCPMQTEQCRFCCATGPSVRVHFHEQKCRVVSEAVFSENL